MSNRLNIYACSGIGATGDADLIKRLVYETEGSSTLENTVAMNMLLSQINYYRTQYLYGNGKKCDDLMQMDKYAICFWFARKYRDNEAELVRIGVNVGIAIAAGYFNCQSENVEDHEVFVDKLIDTIENETGAAENAEDGFVAWWNEYVVGMSIPAASEKEQEIWKESVSGIGAVDKYGIDSNSDLSKYLNDAGSYFTYYICISRSEARKIGKLAAWKWDKQKEVYDYCVNAFVGVYGTEESLLRIIESGLMETYENSTDTIHDILVSGKSPERVGDLVLIFSLICSVIAAITPLLKYVIGLIVDYCKAKVQAKYAVPDNADSAILADEDFSDMEETSSITTVMKSSGGIMMVLLAGGTLLYSMFNNKKK